MRQREKEETVLSTDSNANVAEWVNWRHRKCDELQEEERKLIFV